MTLVIVWKGALYVVAAAFASYHKWLKTHLANHTLVAPTAFPRVGDCQFLLETAGRTLLVSLLEPVLVCPGGGHPQLPWHALSMHDDALVSDTLAMTLCLRISC